MKNHWPIKTLEEVCAINPKLGVLEAPKANDEVTFVPMAAIDEISGKIARPELRLYSQVAKGYTPFRENDILFAKITPCMQNGKAAIACDLRGGLGFGSTEFHVLRPTVSVIPQWIFAFIRQPLFRSAAEANFTGSAGQQRVPADFLKKFPIPIPPLAEQERIVHILDEADELRKLRAQADHRTADLIPALFHEMFGDENGENSKPLGEVCLKITDGVHITPTYVNDGVPFLRVTDIQSEEINWNSVKYISQREYEEITRRVKPEQGDVLYSKNGTIGIAKEISWGRPFAHFVSLALLKPNRTTLNPTFLTSWLNTPDALRQAIGYSKTGTVTNLHLNEIKKMRIPCPSIDTQLSFVRRVIEIREMEAEQAKSKSRLDALFQSLLHRAFEGEF